MYHASAPTPAETHPAKTNTLPAVRAQTVHTMLRATSMSPWSSAQRISSKTRSASSTLPSSTCKSARCHLNSRSAPRMHDAPNRAATRKQQRQAKHHHRT
eukprot:3928736-Pleurochrysis_carterae.AAC.3